LNQNEFFSIKFFLKALFFGAQILDQREMFFSEAMALVCLNSMNEIKNLLSVFSLLAISLW